MGPFGGEPPVPLPQRRSRPWLPPLRKLVRDERRWWYPAPDVAGRYGECRLRVWKASLAGHFAVVTELGFGVTVTTAVEHIWKKLEAEYGHPFGLAEYWPEGESGPAHVDLVMPPRPGLSREWHRLWPVPPSNPDAGMCEMWWAVFGQEVLAA